VFPNAKGNPTDGDNLHHRHWKLLLKRAELPDIRFHDLRHTCATTLLLTKGAHPKIVSKMLGHSSVSLTLDTYSHVIRTNHSPTPVSYNNSCVRSSKRPLVLFDNVDHSYRLACLERHER
jgi:integrase